MAEDIAHWLDGLGLGEYAPVFAENDIDLEVLPHLMDEDLGRLGLSLGHMRKLQVAIKALSVDEPPDRPTSPPNQDPEPHPVEAERRQLTVMFCDLVGSTELSRQLDPEDLREIMRRYQDAVAGAVSRYGGHVAKYLGDGVLAYFGWPQAHEDQAESAVRAGMDAVQAVAAVAAGDAVLAARIGIATGDVVVGELSGEEGAIVGATPNLAARLQNEAAPGEVVIGAATRRLVDGLFEVSDIGTRELRGFAEPVSVWRVDGERIT